MPDATQPSGVPVAYHVCRTDPCDHTEPSEYDDLKQLLTEAGGELTLRISDGELRYRAERFRAWREVVETAKALADGARQSSAPRTPAFQSFLDAVERLTDLERTDRAS